MNQLALFKPARKVRKKTRAKEPKQKKEPVRPHHVYYLHRKIKAYGFKINSAKREIDTGDYSRFSDIPVGPRYYIGQLIKHGYNVQLKLI